MHFTAWLVRAVQMAISTGKSEDLVLLIGQLDWRALWVCVASMRLTFSLSVLAFEQCLGRKKKGKKRSSRG